MKVTATGPVGSLAVQRSSRNSGAASAFALEKSGETKGAVPVSGAATIAAIDAIIALQGVPDATTSRARAIKRADSMLDILDQIRIGLLEGEVPESLLKRLIVLVQTRREEFTDPRLGTILDDIDLRAQVELAKFKQSF